MNMAEESTEHLPGGWGSWKKKKREIFPIYQLLWVKFTQEDTEDHKLAFLDRSEFRKEIGILDISPPEAWVVCYMTPTIHWNTS